MSKASIYPSTMTHDSATYAFGANICLRYHRGRDATQMHSLQAYRSSAVQKENLNSAQYVTITITESHERELV